MGLVLACFLQSQTLLGWTRECEYSCVDTTVVQTVDSMSFCPLTISYDTGDVDDDSED